MWHLYPIRVDKSIRKNVYNELRSHDILVQVNYFPAHLHPVFHEKYEWGSFPIAEEFYKSEISLPMSAHLVDEELEYIIDTLNRISRKYEWKNQSSKKTSVQYGFENEYAYFIFCCEIVQNFWIFFSGEDKSF